VPESLSSSMPIKPVVTSPADVVARTRDHHYASSHGESGGGSARATGCAVELLKSRGEFG
jgi:hypothetical protein